MSNTQPRSIQGAIKSYCENNIGNLTIQRKGNKNKDTEPRQIYYYFLRVFTKMSTREIARTLGIDFDKSVVTYSEKKIKGLMKVDKKFNRRLLVHFNYITENLIHNQ